MSKKVLIADDDDDIRSILAWRCRQHGLEVHTAHNALEAIKKVDELTPDLVCLDVQMPAGNGLSVCEMMAEDPGWKQIPVIILTGKCDENTVRKCNDLCAYYVPKCPGLWDRVGPLVVELLRIPATPSDPAAMAIAFRDFAL